MDKYNWNKINCVEDDKLRSIDSIHEEIYKLGLQLKEQFDSRYPDLIENSKNLYTDDLTEVLNIEPKPVKNIEIKVECDAQNIDIPLEKTEISKYSLECV
mgnify:CR=1 FL=1